MNDEEYENWLLDQQMRALDEDELAAAEHHHYSEQHHYGEQHYYRGCEFFLRGAEWRAVRACSTWHRSVGEGAWAPRHGDETFS